jgi:cytochrome c oxidase subunit IV
MGEKSHVALIWRVFWILFIVTALELAVAFSLPHEWQTLRISIFMGMTLIKAYYIVSEFMHLRYELKSLIWSILIPTIFIIWLVVALLIEGGTT